MLLELKKRAMGRNCIKILYTTALYSRRMGPLRWVMRCH